MPEERGPAMRITDMTLTGDHRRVRQPWPGASPIGEMLYALGITQLDNVTILPDDAGTGWRITGLSDPKPVKRV